VVSEEQLRWTGSLVGSSDPERTHHERRDARLRRCQL